MDEAPDRNKALGRVRFTILDILRAGRGIERTDGYVVLPQKLVDQVEEEIERLNEIERALEEVVQAYGRDLANNEVSTNAHATVPQAIDAARPLIDH